MIDITNDNNDDNDNINKNNDNIKLKESNFLKYDNIVSTPTLRQRMKMKGNH